MADFPRSVTSHLVIQVGRRASPNERSDSRVTAATGQVDFTRLETG